MLIGDKIKKLRMKKEYTREYISSRANISNEYYGRIERSQSNPSVDILECLSKAFDMKIEEFMFFINNPDILDDDLQFRMYEIIYKAFDDKINIYVNNDIIRKNCNNSIWYNGYIGSIHMDEYQIKIYIVGNIKASLYLDYEKIIELNGTSVSDELSTYIKDDKELNNLIEYDFINEEKLNEKAGNVLFVSESNWFQATAINNNNEDLIYDEMILDQSDIIEVFKNYKSLCKTVIDA